MLDTAFFPLFLALMLLLSQMEGQRRLLRKIKVKLTAVMLQQGCDPASIEAELKSIEAKARVSETRRFALILLFVCGGTALGWWVGSLLGSNQGPGGLGAMVGCVVGGLIGIVLPKLFENEEKYEGVHAT